MFRMIRYLSGKSAITGFTFNATGLYFFFGIFFAAAGVIAYAVVSGSVAVSVKVFVGSFVMYVS